MPEDLEHVSSKKLIDRLDEFLGFPKFDPHGDPIPDINGNFTVTRVISLQDMAINTKAVVSNIKDQSTEILEVLQHKNISIGTRLEVKKRFGFDNSLEVKIGRQPVITISEQLAKNIFVTHD